MGATLVWLPVGLLCIFTGRVGAGVGELLYGALIVTTFVDYVVRPRLVGNSRLPLVFTFIGLFGGVAVFGPIGVVLGPVTVSLCFAVLKIYDEEVVSEIVTPP